MRERTSAYGPERECSAIVEKPERIRELEDVLLLVIMFFTLVTWIIALLRLLIG